MKRKLFLAVLVVFIASMVVGCVTQPKFSDYVGMSAPDAEGRLNRKKSSNTMRLVFSWIWGSATLWIASIFNTTRYISYQKDFRSIGSRIAATPDGSLVGSGVAVASPNIVQAGSIQRTESTNVVGIDSKKLDAAITKVTNGLAGKMPKDTTVAVLSISASNASTSEYVIGELEFNLVNTGKFKIVDRRGLEQIKTEQNFQISGDVSDDSAVSIGNMLGANIVITGGIISAGSTQRLSVKALDVQTTQIIAMERGDL